MTEKLEKLAMEQSGGAMSRRVFIQKGAILTGGLAAATHVVDAFDSTLTYAAQVDPKDPALASSEVKFRSTDGKSIGGYLTQPKEQGPHPAVIVIHENRGLNDHIRDVARRLAKAGYVALAPDMLSRQGGTASFSNDEAAIEGIRKVSEEEVTKDLTGAINHLKGQNFVRPDRIGVTGFCWGGGNALLIATRNKDLAAAVVYYGRSPRNLDDVKEITAPVLGHYGENDERINAGIPAL